MNLTNLKILDSLRGIAAFYVLVHHARLVLTQPFYEGYLKHPEAYDYADKLMVYLFASFKWGHHAVLLFFVLSGFVIHLQQAKNGNTAIFRFKQYLLKRAFRIYPTLLFAFFLSFFLDFVYAFIISEENYITAIYSIKLLLENILLIPDSGAWGQNYPVWSLKHEWFFYLVYPLLYFISKKGIWFSLIIPIALFLLFLLGIRLPLLGEAMHTLLIWWLGMFLAEIYVKQKMVWLKTLKWGALVSIVLLFTPLPLDTLLSDLLWGIIFSGIILLLLSQKKNRLNTILLSLGVLGDISYTLYLCHSPILMFIRNLYLRFSHTQQVPYHYWLVILGILLTIPCVYLFYLIVEKPSKQFKDMVFQKTNKH